MEVDGGYNETNCPTCWGEYNYGYESNYVSPWITDSVNLIGEDADDRLRMFHYGQIADSFIAGTTGWQLWDQATNAGRQSASIQSNNMVLTSISDINPLESVPEPATILLLGSGLIGLGFFRRKTSIA